MKEDLGKLYTPGQELPPFYVKYALSILVFSLYYK